MTKETNLQQRELKKPKLIVWKTVPFSPVRLKMPDLEIPVLDTY